MRGFRWRQYFGGPLHEKAGIKSILAFGKWSIAATLSAALGYGKDRSGFLSEVPGTHPPREVHSMSRGRKTSLKPFLLLLLSAFLAAGCGGDSNSTDFGTGPGTARPVSGIHPPGWLPDGHTPEAKANVQSCADCHGNDFAGGTTNIGCTQCHLGNQNSIHPTQWGTFAYALHGNYVKVNGTSSCANVTCHGANLNGVPGSGPSCTQCHMGGPNSKHPVEWNTNIKLHKDYVASNGSSSCRSSVCHGTDLKGVFLSGPSCGACHPWAG